MRNVIARSHRDIEKYRDKIYKSKVACRKEWTELPFDEKLSISQRLHKFGVGFKKCKKIEGK